MVVRKFTAKQLDDLDLPYSGVHTEYEDEHRWYTIKEVVFPFEDTHYAVKYYKEKGEMGDMDCWSGKSCGDNDNFEVDAVEVKLVKVMVDKYIPV